MKGFYMNLEYAAYLLNENFILNEDAEIKDL